MHVENLFVLCRPLFAYRGLDTQIGNLNENGEVVSVKQLETGVPMILRGTMAESRSNMRGSYEKWGKAAAFGLDVVDDPEDAL